MFSPKSEYTIVRRNFPIKDFSDYYDEFVVRPPYQRKTVWSNKKQQDLLDSLFRNYYVPRIVIREVRLEHNRLVFEVIDGQQRIITVQRFIAGNLVLPESLTDVAPELSGARYIELKPDIRRFVDRDLIYIADVIKGIEKPDDPDHQKIATEIFWRLQQGESLNFMEIAHSRLSSLVRNFVVKYADDQRFDYKNYVPIDGNPDKHHLFKVISRNNNRMQHLALLTRLLILTHSDGPADIRDVDVMRIVNESQVLDGIGNLSYESKDHSKKLISNLNVFYDIFKNDPMVSDNKGLQEFSIEYFIVSTYLLLHHLLKYYVFDDKEKQLFHDFIIGFHIRWRNKEENDTDILVYSDNRQQNSGDIEIRDRIIRQAFFDFINLQGHSMLTKDERRAFSEADRIRIYRKGNGLCQMCIEEGKPEKDCRVTWKEFQADHVVPHSKGGRTIIDNAQVLCRYHNAQKGAKT